MTESFYQNGSHQSASSHRISTSFSSTKRVKGSNAVAQPASKRTIETGKVNSANLVVKNEIHEDYSHKTPAAALADKRSLDDPYSLSSQAVSGRTSSTDENHARMHATTIADKNLVYPTPLMDTPSPPRRYFYDPDKSCDTDSLSSASSCPSLPRSTSASERYGSETSLTSDPSGSDLDLNDLHPRETSEATPRVFLNATTNTKAADETKGGNRNLRVEEYNKDAKRKDEKSSSAYAEPLCIVEANDSRETQARGKPWSTVSNSVTASALETRTVRVSESKTPQRVEQNVQDASLSLPTSPVTQKHKHDASEPTVSVIHISNLSDIPMPLVIKPRVEHVAPSNSKKFNSHSPSAFTKVKCKTNGSSNARPGNDFQSPVLQNPEQRQFSSASVSLEARQGKDSQSVQHRSPQKKEQSEPTFYSPADKKHQPESTELRSPGKVQTPSSDHETDIIVWKRRSAVLREERGEDPYTPPTDRTFYSISTDSGYVDIASLSPSSGAFSPEAHQQLGTDSCRGPPMASTGRRHVSLTSPSSLRPIAEVGHSSRSAEKLLPPSSSAPVTPTAGGRMGVSPDAESLASSSVSGDGDRKLSLLDALHRRYCAHQYEDTEEGTVPFQRSQSLRVTRAPPGATAQGQDKFLQMLPPTFTLGPVNPNQPGDGKTSAPVDATHHEATRPTHLPLLNGLGGKIPKKEATISPPSVTVTETVHSPTRKPSPAVESLFSAPNKAKNSLTQEQGRKHSENKASHVINQNQFEDKRLQRPTATDKENSTNHNAISKHQSKTPTEPIVTFRAITSTDLPIPPSTHSLPDRKTTSPAYNALNPHDECTHLLASNTVGAPRVPGGTPRLGRRDVLPLTEGEETDALSSSASEGEDTPVGGTPTPTEDLGELEEQPSANNQGSAALESAELRNKAKTPMDTPEPELEAAEACRWLRAAGCPQYAQMYEDQLFPLDVDSVAKDHDFLDTDALQSLFRRLQTLNRCAALKITPTAQKPQCQPGGEESEEEEPCALSDHWQFQPTDKRWSRLHEEREDQDDLISGDSRASMRIHSSRADSSCEKLTSRASRDSSASRSERDRLRPASDGEAMGEEREGSPRLLHRASQRLKGSARSMLHRMDKMRNSKRRSRSSHYRRDLSAGPAQRDGVSISQPVLVNESEMNSRLDHLNCVDLEPRKDNPPSLAAVAGVETVEDATRLSASPELGVQTRRSMPQSSSTGRLHRFNTVGGRGRGRGRGNRDTDLHYATIRHSAMPVLTSDPNAVRYREELVIPEDTKPGAFPMEISTNLIEIKPDFDSLPRLRESRPVSSTVSAEEDILEEVVLPASPVDFASQGQAVKMMSASRMSVYDNVDDDKSLEERERELDGILSDLLKNIDSLGGDTEDVLTGTTNSPEYRAERPVHFSSPPARLFERDSEDKSSDLDTPGSSIVTPETPQSQRAAETSLDPDKLSSASSSSPDVHLSEDDPVPEETGRERRDSGVGSSLTRSPGERKRTRLRWHSFQKSHRPSAASRGLQIFTLSANQVLVLRKLALIKVTAAMERYLPGSRSGFSWTMPKFMRRQKQPDYSERTVFGVPPTVILRRSGQPLPQVILRVMRWLRKSGSHAVGVFRKPGVKARITRLRQTMEDNHDTVEFDGQQPYDVADVLKLYFRQLPECLLTNKMCETFLHIQQFVPENERVEALQATILLLPDENREVLQALLYLLSDMAQDSHINQMSISNMAVCFAPSLFNLADGSMSPSPQRTSRKSPGGSSQGMPGQKALLEQKAAYECLTLMIQHCKKLFTIPPDGLAKCRLAVMVEGRPITLSALDRKYGDGKGYRAFMEEHVAALLKEANEKWKHWASHQHHHGSISGSSGATTIEGVSVWSRKPGDGNPLRQWRASCEVPAEPHAILQRLLHDRQMWDEDLVNRRVVERLDKDTQVFQYVVGSMAPHPSRDYVELRTCRTNLPRNACCLVGVGIDHSEAPLLGGVRGVVLTSRYYIEPTGGGKSKVTHVARIDTRGRSPEWYNRCFGHTLASYLVKLRESYEPPNQLAVVAETDV